MPLARTLEHLLQQLEASGRLYAVVGGLAASVRGEVRFTRDVDVVVQVDDDEQAEAMVYELRGCGYEVLATVEQEAVKRLATTRLRSAISDVVCDLIFATCGIEAEVVASASSIELLPGRSAPTASSETLLAMKILSATSQRPRDLGDIQALHRANPDLDEARVRQLLRAIAARGFARGQELEHKWARLRFELGV